MIKPLPPARFCRHGFTIMELAIVLVVLGLVASGVLLAQDLNKAGKLRVIEAQLGKYEAAVTAFRDKYQALPGDYAQATDSWGIAFGDGVSVACQHTETTGLPTCNGNGNGIIDDNVTANDESFHAWQHLANAQYIDGTFNGTTNGMTAPSAMLDTTVPATKLDGVGYQFASRNKTTLSWVNAPDGGFDIPVIMLGGPAAGATIQINQPVLDAYSVGTIDEKIDDGKPGAGKVFVAPDTARNCVTSLDATTSQYKMADTGLVSRCMLYYEYLAP